MEQAQAQRPRPAEGGVGPGNMPHPPAGSVPRWLSAAPAVAGVVVIAISLLVLVGWLVGADALKRMLPGLPVMKANTALGLLVAGVALCCLREGTSPRTQRIGRILGVAVALLGVAVLVEYLFGGDRDRPAAVA